MKRNWDVIRDVLIEVESLNGAKFDTVQYGPESESDFPERDAQGSLLWKAGFIEGADASSMDGDAVLATSLTWAGHELLDTMRSGPIWERIKTMATEKGVELTFDAVKVLGKAAMAAIFGG